MKRHRISFTHALEGVVTAYQTQPNYRVHLTLSLLSITAGLFLHISSQEWAIIIFTIFTGLAIELINTSIEFTVDLMTKEYNLLAKFAKDTAAAAMLLYAIGAVGVAVFVFMPRIINLWPFI